MYLEDVLETRPMRIESEKEQTKSNVQTENLLLSKMPGN